MKKIEAKIVADSINQQGDRITTYLLTFPRFILAELNTHRVFSKNSASSRAIPFEKMVKMVEDDPFIPIAWQSKHSGMQGTEYLDGETEQKLLVNKWLEARDLAVQQAKLLNNSNVTKQLCNRLLEPFMWHTVLLTGTEFKNFFELRCPDFDGFKSRKEWLKHNPEFMYAENDDMFFHSINKGQAEIHMGALAEAMYDAYNESTPKKLESGEWHIPFGDKMDNTQLKLQVVNHWNRTDSKRVLAHASRFEYVTNGDVEFNMIKQKIATARCARLSYMTFDGEIDYEKDLKLHDTLLKSQHMSPFEHCARAMSDDEISRFVKGHNASAVYTNENKEEDEPYEYTDAFGSDSHGWCNNFKGFIQYRYLIENDYENNNKFY